jgi:hypothetical protein
MCTNEPTFYDTNSLIDFPKSSVRGSWKRRTFVTRKRAKFTGAFLHFCGAITPISFHLHNSMHSFCQRQYPEVLKMCVSIAYQKETKSWETPEPEERYFLQFGKEE